MSRTPCRLAVAVVAVVAALATVPAAAQQALNFNHTVNAFVEAPHSASLVPTAGITVEAWVTYTPVATLAIPNYPTIVREDQANSQEAYFLRVQSPGQLRWKIKTTVGQFNAVATPNFAPASATHVAGTYDGTTMNLYINGNLAATSPATGVLSDTANGTFRIGKGDDAGGNGEVWNGTIDEVRLWPYGRTQAEIRSTMGMTLDSVPGVVSVWHLDGNTFDANGVNNATLTGTATFVPPPKFLTPFTYAPAPGNFGTPTPGCAGNPTLGVTSVPMVGNAAFALACQNGPPLGGSGLLALGFVQAAPPYVISGATVIVDIFDAYTQVFNVTTTTFGNSFVPFPIPNDPTIVGITGLFQVAWFDACAVGGISASDALAVTIAPGA